MTESIESPKSSEVVTNKPFTPKTQADFYKHQYEIQFKKLSKEAQELLLTNLSKPTPVIRGVQTEHTNVRSFILGVIYEAEVAFEKSQAKAAQAVTVTK
jgi:hypothetical protein